MRESAKRRVPELAPLYELAEFARGVEAFAVAAEPRPGMEARVLARLQAEQMHARRTWRPWTRPAGWWSVAAATGLLAFIFLGHRGAPPQTGSRAIPAQVTAGASPGRFFKDGSRGAAAITIKTADAQRAPLTPVPVGRRQGRATHGASAARGNMPAEALPNQSQSGSHGSIEKR